MLLPSVRAPTKPLTTSITRASHLEPLAANRIAPEGIGPTAFRSTLVAAVDPRAGAAVALHKVCEALVAPPLHVFNRGIAGIPACGERSASCLKNSAELRTMSQIPSDRQSLISPTMEADLRMRSSTALFP